MEKIGIIGNWRRMVKYHNFLTKINIIQTSESVMPIQTKGILKEKQ